MAANRGYQKLTHSHTEKAWGGDVGGCWKVGGRGVDGAESI